MCTAKMRSSCEHIFVFPYVFWPLVLHFSLLFPFLSCFFFGSSVVDYSAVMVACPSIAFFFAHLGCLLKSVEGGVS